MGFISLRLTLDAENNLAGRQHFETFLAGKNPAIGRKNAADAH
jgi:hypothetical protein